MTLTRFDNVDLSELPAPDVIEPLDYEAILAAMRDDLVARMPEIANVIDLESEPARKLMEAFAYREMLLRSRINESARAVLLPYARGADLDNVGAMFGVARGDGETDERLRRRIRLAPEAFGTAGAAGAYVYHALSRAPWARDASACGCRSGRPGIVQINMLAEGDDPVPSRDQLRELSDFFRRPDIRPLTDVVQVLPAWIEPVDIRARLTLYPGPTAAPILEAATARLSAWVESNRMLGGNLRRSAIMHQLHVDGVHSVDLIEPSADVVLDVWQCYAIRDFDVTVETSRDE